MVISREQSGSSESTAAPQLRALLDLGRLVRAEGDLPTLLDELARIIAAAIGFRTVVVNLHHEAGDEYEVTTVHGNERARRHLLGHIAPAATWAPMLDERFAVHGAYFVPAGALDWDESPAVYTPEIAVPTSQDAGAWHPHDALFVPLDAAGGRRYGIISVDEPQDGRRPDGDRLEVLSAIAAHAAQTIENAQRLVQLGAAARRHRAVIESSLDGVIAIDPDGRMVEFNGAAERIFGHRAVDVLGRELAEVIIAPEDREAHLRGLRRGFQRGEWRLLGRRFEVNGMRADGTRLPVELSLTHVEDGGDGRPLVYGFVRDISERRRTEEQLAFLAYHDPLTGLPNRVAVEQQLDLALARARREGGAVALMFIDLDDFKDVNDRLGHAAGDELLTGVAARLRSVLRDSDVLARQGGDEFLVLLFDLADDPILATELVATKLLDALRDPFAAGGAEVHTQASIGISLFPSDAADTEALMRHADAAMYRAKRGGGGRLAHHDAGDAIAARAAGGLGPLGQAFAESELELR